MVFLPENKRAIILYRMMAPGSTRSSVLATSSGGGRHANADARNKQAEQ
jgi:hypothetical protein